MFPHQMFVDFNSEAIWDAEIFLLAIKFLCGNVLTANSTSSVNIWVF